MFIQRKTVSAKGEGKGEDEGENREEMKGGREGGRNQAFGCCNWLRACALTPNMPGLGGREGRVKRRQDFSRVL